eukprot:sb/3467849/
MGGFHSNAHNSSKSRLKRLNQKQCCRKLSGEHFGCKIDIRTWIKPRAIFLEIAALSRVTQTIGAKCSTVLQRIFKNCIPPPSRRPALKSGCFVSADKRFLGMLPSNFPTIPSDKTFCFFKHPFSLSSFFLVLSSHFPSVFQPDCAQTCTLDDCKAAVGNTENTVKNILMNLRWSVQPAADKLSDLHQISHELSIVAMCVRATMGSLSSDKASTVHGNTEDVIQNFVNALEREREREREREKEKENLSLSLYLSIYLGLQFRSRGVYNFFFRFIPSLSNHRF